MEHTSCQSDASIEHRSDQSELDDSDDPAFAKTPIRADSASDASSACDSDSSDSGASRHLNEYGDKTYFHVWSDMLTCTEMAQLDQRALEEAPAYVEGDELELDPRQKPLSIDTSLPCPLIQFGPIPKKRPSAAAVAAAAAAAAATTAAAKSKEQQEEPVAGDVEAAASSAPAAPQSAAKAEAALPDDEADQQQHRHHIYGGERCCDFSLVAAKNRARLREIEKAKRREQKRLVRY